MKKQPSSYSYYDAEGDVFYIRKQSGAEEEFVEVAPGVNVELNDKQEIIGIEILNASKVFSELKRPQSKKTKSPHRQVKPLS